MKIKLIVIIGFFSLTSCSSDSISDLGEPIAQNEITYNLKVKSIIDNNCIVCHGTVTTNGASISLTTYENVKNATLTNALLNRISRTEGSAGAMPLGSARLPQSDINAISNWINANFPE